SLVPSGARTLLDVGAGSGDVAHRVAEAVPALEPAGVDVLVRAQTAIPVERFDGVHVPRADRSVDVALLVDVLHHASQPARLLAECSRVARLRVVVKDHIQRNASERMTARLRASRRSA